MKLQIKITAKILFKTSVNKSLTFHWDKNPSALIGSEWSGTARSDTCVEKQRFYSRLNTRTKLADTCISFCPENWAPEGCPCFRPCSWPVLFTHIKKPCNLLRLSELAQVRWASPRPQRYFCEHFTGIVEPQNINQLRYLPILSSPTGIFGRGDKHPIVFFHDFSHTNSSQAVKCQYNPQNISLLNKAEEQ